MFLALRNNI